MDCLPHFESKVDCLSICGQKAILTTTTNHIIARWNIDEIVLQHWILQRRRDLLKN
jgi:hypothetical protein